MCRVSDGRPDLTVTFLDGRCYERTAHGTELVARSVVRPTGHHALVVVLHKDALTCGARLHTVPGRDGVVVAANAEATPVGVDYASSSDKAREKDRDNFALAFGRAIPGGGIVLVDGIRGKLSQGESEEKVKAFASIQPFLSLIGFEKLGKGYDSMWNLINSGLPIIPCPHDGERVRPKGDRFERAGGLGPLFQFSRAWISDLETPFLKAFKDEWAQWPGGKNDDTLDAVYWMCYVAQGLLIPPPDSDLLGMRREHKPSPFATMGKELSGARR